MATVDLGFRALLAPCTKKPVCLSLLQSFLFGFAFGICYIVPFACSCYILPLSSIFSACPHFLV